MSISLWLENGSRYVNLLTEIKVNVNLQNKQFFYLYGNNFVMAIFMDRGTYNIFDFRVNQSYIPPIFLAPSLLICFLSSLRKCAKSSVKRSFSSCKNADVKHIVML